MLNPYTSLRVLISTRPGTHSPRDGESDGKGGGGRAE